MRNVLLAASLFLSSYASASLLCVEALKAELAESRARELGVLIHRESLSKIELDDFVEKLKFVPEFQCVSNGCAMRATLAAYEIEKQYGVETQILEISPTFSEHIVLYLDDSSLSKHFVRHYVVLVPVIERGLIEKYVIDYPMYPYPVSYDEWASRYALGYTLSGRLESRIPKMWLRDILESAAHKIGPKAQEYAIDPQFIERARQVEILLKRDPDFKSAWQNPRFQSFFLSPATLHQESKASFTWRKLLAQVKRNEQIAAVLWNHAGLGAKPRVARIIIEDSFYYNDQEDMALSAGIGPAEVLAEFPSRREVISHLSTHKLFESPNYFFKAKSSWSRRERMGVLAALMGKEFLSPHISLAFEHAMSDGLESTQQRQILLDAGVGAETVNEIIEAGYMQVDSAKEK